MVTREEAIKILQHLAEIVSSGDYQEAFKMAVSALRPVSREMVEKSWRGEWKHYLPPLGAGDVQCRCTRCGRTPDVETPFCAWCGAPMTGEAVDILLKRLEELHDGQMDI